MKKNISINLQGIIFHIEEDGYEQLSRYLASIRTYFSNYEGHEEIISDIEARIAEIFSARLAPGKQVITQEDVQSLITQMGDVTDFELLDTAEEEIPHAAGAAASGAGTGDHAYTQGTSGPKRLYRDVNRKVVAGVCAGIASYLNVDSLWVRLLFVVLVIGIPFTHGFTSFGIVLYLILWIAMPQSSLLPETTVKKLFRDPEDKKIGGVASGIAKYFGVDVAVVRILFLASVFLGGFGLMIYIVIWIAVPEAVTLTERMQMQGNPVTLSGIEQTLKDNLNMKDSNGEESTFARLILLPIRLISQIFSWLGRTLGPILAFLITFIRVAAGVILLIISIGFTIALFTTFFAGLGLIDEPQNFMLGDYPASILLEGFPRLGLVTGFLVGLIPVAFLWILSIALISKQFFLRQIVGWSMFAVWLVSLFTMIAIIMMYTQNFRRTGEIESTKSFNVDRYNTVTLDAFDTSLDYSRVDIELQSHTGNALEVVQRVSAKGKDEADARQNAQMVSYRMLQKDSVIRFDNTFEYKKGAALREQKVNLLLMLPQNKPLRLTSNFLYLLPNAVFDVEYSREKVLRNTWQAKGAYLTCLTCEADTLDQENSTEYAEGFSETVGSAGSVLLALDEYNKNEKVFEVRDFDAIDIRGMFHVQIRQGRDYDVRVHADNEQLEKINVEQDGNELVIETKQRYSNIFSSKDPILVQITVPDLNSLQLSGAVKADVGRLEVSDLELSLSGATKAAMNVSADRIRADISGASHTSFAGRANHFELDASGASKIDAANMISENVRLSASGACDANVYANNSLEVDASGGSSITYGGNPGSVQTDVSGASKVKRK
ncbi:PspC domain-containing protein [Pontibacter sp. SGAir0037]|uniref:PspC domain-containing protein n=1 Tax=Pontibacter sp. SGAir0037 TaxID=2571030 RepID=UPI0010CD4E71|nr:PspC domain-containing protein [Pontibacter sp. SGAir0037]QCR22936.1 hypothetical protein C1N53_11670 [Pontibacter sp. SGAir0037]